MADDLLNLAPPDASEIAKLELRPMELLKQGWALVKPSYFELLIVGVAFGVLNFVLGKIPFGGILGLVVAALLSPGVTYFLLQRYRGNKVDLSAVMVPAQTKTVELLIVGIITSILSAIGFALLFLPGIYVTAVLLFSMPLVLLTSTGAIDALKRSHALVSTRLGDFIILILGLLLANIVGAIPCGLGLLVSLPATIGAMTLVAARLFRIAPGTTAIAASTPG